MKTSLFTLPDDRMTFTEAVDYAKSLGLDAIEPYPRSEFFTPDVDSAKRLADYAASKEIGIACFSMAANIVAGNIREEIETIKRYIDVAAALGSPYLHHTLYPYLKFTACSLSFREALDRAVEGVREISDYAGERGITCLYEDQGFYFNGVQRFDDFLGAVNRNVGVVADFGNILFVDETPEAFIARFAPFIRHVHVKDYLSKDARWPAPGRGWYPSRGGGYLRGTVIGHGVVNFHRCLSILNSIGYDAFYSVEYDGMEDARLAHEMGIENLRRFHEAARLDDTKYADVRMHTRTNA